MPQATVQPDLYTTSEAAALLRVDRETMRRWCDSGHVQCIRLPVGGHRRIPRAEVDRLLTPLARATTA